MNQIKRPRNNLSPPPNSQDIQMTELSTNGVTFQNFPFRFKKNKLGDKRPSLEISLPVPNGEGLMAIIRKGGKGLELLVDSVAGTIRSVAYEIVANKPDISQENFPLKEVDWEAIANMERQERQTISQEQWEAFAADYLAVMPGLTGKKQEQVQMAVELYVKKLVAVRTNKPVLSRLKDQLALYLETPNAENFQDILEVLLRRVETYLTADETIITADNV